MMLWKLIPSKAKLYAGLAFIGALALAWLRHDARRDAQNDLSLKDYEHANDIETRVDHSRADPERLRQYEGNGWRD